MSTYVDPHRARPWGAILTPVNPEPEPMPDITLVGPPQDQTQQSLNTLRQFCQTYEFPPGTRPYAGDEIHSGGLYLSDGLLYFLLETWAPIMMDPDDPSPWDTKRQRADAALQTYMRRRVGDTGGVQPGVLSGPISTNGRAFVVPE